MDLIETFKIIHSTSPTTLEVEVNGHKRHGWQLHGPFFQDPRTGEFFQAVDRPMPAEQQERQQLAA